MQVLGDIVESIAGAVLIDTKLDLDVVWGVFKPLLSPIVTPENLELPPFRELLEWCSKNGYFVEIKCTVGEKIEATLGVQLKEKLLVRHGCGTNKKDSKAHAASMLLMDLQVSFSFLCFQYFHIGLLWWLFKVQLFNPSDVQFSSAERRTSNPQECKQDSTCKWQ
jgi:hypothetical protein